MFYNMLFLEIILFIKVKQSRIKLRESGKIRLIKLFNLFILYRIFKMNSFNNIGYCRYRLFQLIETFYV